MQPPLAKPKPSMAPSKAAPGRRMSDLLSALISPWPLQPKAKAPPVAKAGMAAAKAKAKANPKAVPKAAEQQTKAAPAGKGQGSPVTAAEPKTLQLSSSNCYP